MGIGIIKRYEKVEDVFEDLGGFSRYQIWITGALIYPQVMFALIILSPIFTGSSQVHLFCKNVTYSLDEDATFEPNRCGLRNCTIRKLNEAYVSVVQEWDLVCDKSWVVDTITSCQMAGMMSGAFTFSIFADIYGRKKCFVIQTTLMGLLGMAPALATSPWGYAVARFFAGFGIGACYVVYLSHLMEFLTPTWRMLGTALSIYPIGEMLLPLLAYNIRSWRWLTVMTGLPIFLILPFSGTVLESPRWLLTQKRTEDALKVFQKIAKWNGKTEPTLEQITYLQTIMLLHESGTLRGFKALKVIVSNRKLKLNMMIETLCTMTCGVIYYGVSFNSKNISGDPYMNIFYMGVCDIFATPFGVLFNKCLDRRRTFILLIFLGTIFIGAVAGVEYGFHLSKSTPLLVTSLLLFGRFFILAAWAALKCMIMETSPTNLRSSCLGFTAFAGYFGSIMAPQLVLLSRVSLSLPYIILCLMSVVSSFSSWFLSETLEKPLEDTVAEDVDLPVNNNNAQPITALPSKLVNKIWTFLDTTLLVNPLATQVESLETNTSTFIPPGSIFIIQSRDSTARTLVKTHSLQLTDVPSH